jgi:DNA-binding NarL/FixJ family response regulator
LKQFSKGDIPDVILQDIQLPGINGIEGIALYKKVCPSAHVIMLTVYDDDENLFNAMCAGASGYLMKNSPQDAIVRSIQEVMNGGAPMNPHIATKVLHLFSKFVNQKNDYGLTQREKEILQEVVNGLTIQQIADKLFLSYHTVNTHLKNIYSKLQVNTRSGVIAKAFKEHLI